AFLVELGEDKSIDRVLHPLCAIDYRWSSGGRFGEDPLPMRILGQGCPIGRHLVNGEDEFLDSGIRQRRSQRHLRLPGASEVRDESASFRVTRNETRAMLAAMNRGFKTFQIQAALRSFRVVTCGAMLLHNRLNSVAIRRFVVRGL